MNETKTVHMPEHDRVVELRLLEQDCVACGSSFEYMWYPGSFPRCYCSDECRIERQRAVDRQRKAAKRAELREQQDTPRPRGRPRKQQV